MQGSWLLGAVALLAGTLFAPSAHAQTIKPLDIEQDPIGVDMLSGTIETPMPELSIPAAPNLKFQRLQNLQPILNGQLIQFTDNSYYEINTGGIPVTPPAG